MNARAVHGCCTDTRACARVQTRLKIDHVHGLCRCALLFFDQGLRRLRYGLSPTYGKCLSAGAYDGEHIESVRVACGVIRCTFARMIQQLQAEHEKYICYAHGHSLCHSVCSACSCCVCTSTCVRDVYTFSCSTTAEDWTLSLTATARRDHHTGASPV